MTEAKVIQVIEARCLRGVGTEENPHRLVTAYFTLDGELLADLDPFVTSNPVAKDSAAQGRSAAGSSPREKHK